MRMNLESGPEIQIYVPDAAQKFLPLSEGVQGLFRSNFIAALLVTLGKKKICELISAKNLVYLIELILKNKQLLNIK